MASAAELPDDRSYDADIASAAAAAAVQDPVAPDPAAAEQGEVLYRTKVIEFLGRSIPIVLQKDNGPCPLIAICNVMLLRNHIKLSLDSSEVSLQRLLSLVADRLIDSNSSVEGKNEEYMNNQRQNISDAIDLLPRLATGIDVNVLFRKINDFEFTSECAIFDLLDIDLYHGWIVDPQDVLTAEAIGSKSYNTLVGELVAFDAGKLEEAKNNVMEEACVDFTAATTATLGVPYPSLSRGRSFDEYLDLATVAHRGRRGDLEEAEELTRALNLSRIEMSYSANISMSNDVNPNYPIMDKITCAGCPENRTDFVMLKTGVESENSRNADLLFPVECNALIDDSNINQSNILLTGSDVSGHDVAIGNDIAQSETKLSDSSNTANNIETSLFGHKSSPSLLIKELVSNGTDDHIDQTIQRESPISSEPFIDDTASSKLHRLSDDLMNTESESESSTGPVPFSEGVTSSLEGSEPIYEGEECILDSQISAFEDKEPIFEDKVVILEQADKKEEIANSALSKDEVDHEKCLLIKTFLHDNQSQLTIYGLFCLQDGLKEREPCVFFRNNHFNVMFKLDGELYVLATDQGYLSHDLVWEKLNEVKGDSLFVTGNFTEFKPLYPSNDSWNEQNVMTSTADYLGSLEAADATSSSFNSDLQLAIALQQQEFDSQPQRQLQQSTQPSPPSPATGRSMLVIGPQVWLIFLVFCIISNLHELHGFVAMKNLYSLSCFLPAYLNLLVQPYRLW